MKLINIIKGGLLIAVVVVFSSCKKEGCYKCQKSYDTGGSSTKSFCLPRKDAKDKKKSLESLGYDCQKISNR